MPHLSAFCNLLAPVPLRSSASSSFMVPRRPNPACTFALSRRTSPRMALPDIYDLASRTVLYLATKADIGPFTNVDVESTGLFAAIGGGSLLAALVMLVIIRF